MDGFPRAHPWMTLLLGLAAINGIVILFRGYNPAWSIVPNKGISTADKVAGLFGMPGAPGSNAVGAMFGANVNVSGFPRAAPINRAVWGHV